MAFFLQLKILLWKNFTLKRRSPLVLLFEVCIPLVLFVILLCIRHKLPPYPKPAITNHETKPLPSAGVLSILQTFCTNQETDNYRLPVTPESVHDLLENLQNIAEHNNFFQPDFSLDELANIPPIYESIIDDPAAAHDIFLKAKDIEVEDLLTNASVTEEALVKQFPLDPYSVHIVLQSTVNFTEVYRLLFGLSSFIQPDGRNRRSLLDNSAANPGFHFDKSLIYKVIRNNPKLLLDPEVRDVIAHLTGIGSPTDLDPREVVDVLKKVALSTDGVRMLVCEDHELDHVLIPPSPNDTAAIERARVELCSMTDKQWVSLATLLRGAFSTNHILIKLHLEDLNMTVAQARMHNFQSNLREFILFEKNIIALDALAADLPLDACPGDVPMTTQSPETTEIDLMTTETDSNTTDIDMPSGPRYHVLHEEEAPHERLKRSLGNNKYGGLIAIWLAMQKTICGNSDSTENKLNRFLGSNNLGDLGFNYQQRVNIGILTHVLYSNPKVLYAPRNTDADKVIAKANGTFALLDTISHYAERWLNVSDQLHIYLNKNQTAENLQTIKEMQLELQSMPELVRLIQDPQIQFFIQNTTLPDVDVLIGQLVAVDKVACSWLELTRGLSFDVFEGFDDEDSLVKYFLHHAYHDNKTVFASVIFTNVMEDGSFPPHIIYKLRENATMTDNTKFVRDRYWKPGPAEFGGYNYYMFGFTWIQDMIERAIINVQTGVDIMGPGTFIREMPLPCYMKDQFLFMIEHVMPLCLTISWVYSVAMLVQSIVYEKEQRLKEVMRMMGLSDFIHWLAWFITTFSQMSITMAILTVMLKYGNVLMYSNPLIIFLVLEMFAIVTISFSFLVSVCFSKAKVAAACAGIVYFLTYVPYMYTAIREEAGGDKIPGWTKSLVSLFSTTAFGLGGKYFAYYEIEGVGVHWDNFHVSPVEGDTFSLFWVTVMMAVDAVLYGVLTWYIESVHPGSYGLPKPWYFPFMASYWCGGHLKTESEQCSWRQLFHRLCRRSGISVMEDDQACALNTDHGNSSKFEPEPSHLPLGVHIDNLTKVYKNGKLAVNKLNLNLYEGHITSFLGHNGAGKTSTMSLLSGMFPPTSGYASVYGCDIRTDMDEIRSSLGMCPQHNVLFDKLTVAEHLWFYARLKGMEDADIQQEMDRMINDVGLPKKRHHTIDCLSGGMQRKLSVAIAFVAGSRTIILDEPTAGIDPFARRAIWDLLIKYKEGRTILLSTHHMDEADILGDRIAIISNGSIKCSGSSLFLKSVFGEGYHLTLVKKASEDDIRSVDTIDSMTGRSSFLTKCQEASVTAFIVDHVPAAFLKWESHQELQYTLPFAEAHKGGFERLFQALDNHMARLHISSYGVMDTSLEEVFLKVTQAALSSDEENLLNVVREEEVVYGPTNPVPNSISLTNTGAVNREVEMSNITNNASSAISVQHGGPMEASLQTTPSTIQDFIRTHRRTRSHNSFFPINPETLTQHSVTSPGHRKPPQPPKPVEKLRKTHRRTVSNVCETWRSQPGVPEHAQRKPAHTRTTSNVSYVSQQSTDSCLLRMRQSDLQALPITEDVPLLTTKCADPDLPKTRPVIPPMYTGYMLVQQQFVAILIKRFYYTRRNWKGLFSQIILPAMFVCIAMTVALTAPQVSDLPPITLGASQYYNYTQPRGQFIPYANLNQDLSDLHWSMEARGRELLETFHMPSGLGAICLLRKPFNSSFDEDILKNLNSTHRNYNLLAKYFNPECQDVFIKGLPLDNFVPQPPTGPILPVMNDTDVINTNPARSAVNFYPECHCTQDHAGQVCEENGFPHPPMSQAVTSEFLQDITGQDEDMYYLRTYDMYKLHRYGGFTLGLVRDAVPRDFGKGAPSEFRKLAVRHSSIVWFNHKGLHAMPVFINTLNNAILRANMPASKGNPAAYGITAINHPMNSTNSGLSMEKLLQGSDVLIAIFINVAMSFVPASFVVFLVYENHIRAKHLQTVSGLNRVTYWMANYFWDMCNYIIPGCCCIIILRIFDIPAYVSGANFPAVICLFLLYGWSITPMMYPASFWFREPSSAYIALIVINLFIGITCIITSFLLEMFQSGSPDLAKAHDVLKGIFLIFPNYCLGRGLMDIAFNEYKNEYFFKTGNYDQMLSPFQWTLTSRNLVAMASTGAIFFIITLMCEFRFFIKRKSLVEGTMLSPHEEDVDVANERKRVLRGSGRHDLLRIQNLTKIYKTRKLGRHLAVDRLCLGVPQGECFGLLGVNGAGKTTTFKMLTGDFPPTAGNAFINKNSIVSEVRAVQQSIGYCPQFDALYDELTGREHLQLYARLRGIPYKHQTEVVDWALEKLGLCQYADRLSSTYSGGNKRKLSTAIALLGDPPIVFLDEPTTGMDPHSRRFLWDLILKLVAEGHSIILTSHSMEECEALCSRLAIMVNGRFRCIGSTQHLKSRFGDGYTISIRVNGPHYGKNVTAVSRFMERHLPNGKLKEAHHNLVLYELPSHELSLACVFHQLEEALHDLDIEDYSVSQNTLDNVFINFVSKQQELVHELGVTTVTASAPQQNTELQTILTTATGSHDNDDCLVTDVGGSVEEEAGDVSCLLQCGEDEVDVSHDEPVFLCHQRREESERASLIC